MSAAPRSTAGPNPLIVFLAWTAAGLFFGMQNYVNAFLFGGPAPAAKWILPHLADAWYWALLTFPIFHLALRFRFTRRGWPLALVVHLVGGTAAALGNVLFNRAVRGLMSPARPTTFSSYFSDTFYTDCQWYLFLVGVAYMVTYYRGLRDQEVRAAQLKGSLTIARLEALKMQIQPHFLFNTLHTISELVHEDPHAAERMIVRLADLLRLTVDNKETHEVTLGAEVGFLEAYLDIQRTRFRDRLEVGVDVDPGLGEARVPNLVLQPLVENAIRHGRISPDGSVRILVKCERRGERLRMVVHNSGPPPHPAPAPGSRVGVGMKNTRERIKQLYGADGRLELSECKHGGAIATIEIPFRLSETESAAPSEAAETSPWPPFAVSPAAETQEIPA